MKKIFTISITLLAVVFLSAQSQSSFWQNEIQSQNTIAQPSKSLPAVKAYRTVSLDLPALINHLREAPMKGTEQARNSQLIVSLPMPDGTSEDFKVWESPVMAEELAEQFPMIKTYTGESVSNPGVRVKFDYSPYGFHAFINNVGEAAFIWPAAEDQTEIYHSFYQKDVLIGATDPFFECGTHGENFTDLPMDFAHLKDELELTTNNRGAAVVDLYTYRVAVATTVEYSSQNGNNVNSVLAAVNTVINNVNAVFETEVAISLELVANTSDVFHFGSNGSDPYTNGQTDQMINENPPVLNNIIGPSNYDIGHVFGTNAGGLAQTGSVCSSSKARGVSCTFGLFSGPLFYLIVCHEMGHQFNALHTFNLCDGDNESPPTGYEPGAGSTIMSYSGASDCNAQWINDTGDGYYHINSLERMRAFSRDPNSGASCAVVVPEGNNTPESIIPFAGNFRIPISTPFEMTGMGTDMEDADLTYVWEQYDLGTQSVLGQPMGTAPLFRSFIPSDSPIRIFPRIETIVNNTSHKTEVLPTTTRPLTFRFVTRDNHAGGGGYAFDAIEFSSTDLAGPFLVLAPNDGTEMWEVGQFREVTWDVANTDGVQVNSQWVDIFLSLDGGYTYPVTLLSGTKNDGSAFVVVPDEVTDVARIKVKAADNIFFDISNADFSIVPPSVPGYALVSTPELGIACTPETFDVNLETTALLGFTEPITFTADGLPSGATVSFSSNPVNPGESSVMTIDLADVTDDGDFTVTINATANGVVDASRTVDLNVVNNDFSALQLNSPAGSGNSILPNYQWSDLPNGLSYDIQVATDPDFNNIIDEASNVSDPNYLGNTALEENTVYYWRVRVTNECGTGEYGDVSAFKTVSQECVTYPNASTLAIPSSNGSSVTTTINVGSGGTISDVNVLNVAGAYNAFGDITFRLTSPTLTSVLLMDQQPCSSASPFQLGFDDESIFPTIPCPPNGTTNYKPEEPLAGFIGEDATGDWVLEIKVVTSFGAGGNLNNWDLEICGAAAALDPYLITNEPLALPPGQTYNIVQSFLEVGDDDNTPGELMFTIVHNTSSGFLSLGGTQLGVGDSFTMLDIYSSQLTYTNTDQLAETDFFTFTVDDGNGGFFGMPAFNIVIDEDADPNNVLEGVIDQSIQVYPNPATDLLTVEMVQHQDGGLKGVTMFNAQGQLILERKLEASVVKLELNVGQLPAGVYLVQAITSNGVQSRKVIID